MAGHLLALGRAHGGLRRSCSGGRCPPRARARTAAYGELVGSSLRLLVTEPVLRRRAWHGACAFAAFSVLWTTLAFLLSASPYHYSNAVIGLFGLVGAGGIVAANLAGKLADSARVTATTVVAGVLLAGSFALLWAGRTSLAALIIGIVVLDMGTQGMQITNQAVIYALRPDARSRINSAYMVCYFIGGAAGSLAAGALYGTPRLGRASASSAPASGSSPWPCRPTTGYARPPARRSPRRRSPRRHMRVPDRRQRGSRSRRTTVTLSPTSLPICSRSSPLMGSL